MKLEIEKKKQVSGLLCGLAAGLGFVIFTWGMDWVVLTQAHGGYAWVKLLPGLLICLSSGSFIGWFTFKCKNPTIITIAWIMLGAFYSRLVFWLPLRVAPALIGIFNGGLADYLDYSTTKDINEIVWLGSIIILVVCIGGGEAVKSQVSEYVYSNRVKDLLIPILACLISFGFAGGVSDSLINKKLRQPIVALDQLIQYASENIGKDTPDNVAKPMNLEVIKNYEGYLLRDRLFTPSSFNPSLNQVDILIDFDGVWVKCATAYSRITGCEPAMNTPWIRTTHLIRDRRRG